MNNAKIKFFSMVCKTFDQIEEDVNTFCESVDVIDIKCLDTKVMVIYMETPGVWG